MRGSEATSVRNETRVLAVGATRGTGHLVARSLLREGYAVRILARNAARARKLFGAAVEIVEGDLTAPVTLVAISVGGWDTLSARRASQSAPLVSRW